MTDNCETCLIDLVAYDGVQMSALLGLEDLFTIGNRISKQEDGPVILTRQSNPEKMQEMPQAHAIILPPNLKGKRGDDNNDVPAWLQTQHKRGTIISSVCAGAFWLGRSGLLDNRTATTHWALEDEFRRAFPAVDLNTEELLIDNHDIVTAGGVMAWLDLGLYFVQRWQGSAVMSATARHLLVDPAGRAQKNYRSFRPPLDHGNSAILKTQHWLEQQVSTTISVPQLAQIAAMSDRSFLRHFKLATGYTPNRYIQLLRLENARALLERSRMSVSEISWQCGYQDPAAFGRLFRDITGLSPGEYRKRFGITANNGHKFPVQ